MSDDAITERMEVLEQQIIELRNRLGDAIGRVTPKPELVLQDLTKETLSVGDSDRVGNIRIHDGDGQIGIHMTGNSPKSSAKAPNSVGPLVPNFRPN